MNIWMILGVALQLLVSASLFASRALPPAFALVFAGFAGLSLLGAALVTAGQLRFGGRLVLISSLAFVPIGFIAILGARKALDRATDAAAGSCPDRRAPRELFVATAYRKKMLGLGIALTALGGVVMVAQGRAVGLAVGIVLVGFSIWWSKQPVIRLFKTRMEMKVSPFAPRRIIQLDAVRRIYLKGKKKVFITVADGNKTREMQLPRQLLDAGDFRTLAAALKSAAA